MNKQLKRLFYVVIVMFLVLAFSTTYIQFITADKLNSDPRNTRAFQRAKYQIRGSIYAGDQLLTKSVSAPNQKGARTVYTRAYEPNSNLYAHLLGYINGVDATGLEQFENRTLIGDSSSNLQDRIKEELMGQPKTGTSIRLTVDPALQQAGAQALGGRKGAVVALNYQTGAILAAYSNPGFNLAELSQPEAKAKIKQLNQDKQNRPMLNRALNGEYAPGSAFKLIMAAAAFSNHVRSPETTVDAPVTVRLPGTQNATLSNIDHSSCGNGHPTFAYAFAQSCNTPFVLLSEELGYQAIKEQAEAFGFNSKKHWKVPLPIQVSSWPSRNSDKDPGPAHVAQAAIGQYEVQVTPLMMASVAATVANNGVQIRPFLVAEHLDKTGRSIKKFVGKKAMGVPINADVADQLRDMMRQVVHSGTGRDAAVAEVEMGGKTGTAQVGNGRANAWFVGYANTRKYPLAYAVIVEGDGANPVPHGGPVAGPVARAVIQASQQGGEG